MFQKRWSAFVVIILMIVALSLLMLKTQRDLSVRQPVTKLADPQSTSEVYEGEDALSPTLKQALSQLKNRGGSVKGLELERGASAFLIGSASDDDNVQYFLWTVNGWRATVVKEMDAYWCESVLFNRLGEGFVIALDRSSCGGSSDLIKGYRYSAFDNGGNEFFSYTYDASTRQASTRVGYEYNLSSVKRTDIKLVTSPACFDPNEPASKQTGITINGTFFQLKSKLIDCVNGDEFFGKYVDPAFDFVEYDPEYSTVTLKMPSGEQVIVNVRDGLVMAQKERYSVQGCDEDLGNILYITPSSTKVLVKDFESQLPHNTLWTCWKYYGRAKNGNPLFIGDVPSLHTMPERQFGPYELDLKTLKFKAVK